jgi:hypothetical protein
MVVHDSSNPGVEAAVATWRWRGNAQCDLERLRLSGEVVVETDQGTKRDLFAPPGGPELLIDEIAPIGGRARRRRQNGQPVPGSIHQAV